MNRIHSAKWLVFLVAVFVFVGCDTNSMGGPNEPDETEIENPQGDYSPFEDDSSKVVLVVWGTDGLHRAYSAPFNNPTALDQLPVDPSITLSARFNSDRSKLIIGNTESTILKLFSHLNNSFSEPINLPELPVNPVATFVVEQSEHLVYVSSSVNVSGGRVSVWNVDAGEVVNAFDGWARGIIEGSKVVITSRGMTYWYDIETDSLFAPDRGQFWSRQATGAPYGRIIDVDFDLDSGATALSTGSSGPAESAGIYVIDTNGDILGQFESSDTLRSHATFGPPGYVLYLRWGEHKNSLWAFDYEAGCSRLLIAEDDIPEGRLVGFTF
ncbi:MAG: hypothetical protein RIE53_10420 [Rhodothermales bacterium]